METQVDIKAAVTDLEALLGNLNDGDRKFANSLINGPYGYKVRGSLTDKQKPFVYSLLNRAMGIVPIREKTVVGDCAGITKLFEKAKQHIKYPSIVLGLDQHKIKIWVQGQKAKHPGAIAVTLDGEWVGRILTDGSFQGSKAFGACGVQDELLDLLTQLAKDPEGVATKHGKLHSKCCFCNLPLEDEKSLAVGYGPVCAKHWGLKWGTEKLNLEKVIS